jgi:hypothetical protein
MGQQRCSLYYRSVSLLSQTRGKELFRTGLLGEQETIALLEGDTVSARQNFSMFPDLRDIVSTHLEYLSSGEKRAGWADLVTSPFRTFLRVYTRLPSLSVTYCWSRSVLVSSEVEGKGSGRRRGHTIRCILPQKKKGQSMSITIFPFNNTHLAVLGLFCCEVNGAVAVGGIFLKPNGRSDHSMSQQHYFFSST